MIFESITKTKENDKLSFFVEKVKVYTRLVSLWAKTQGLTVVENVATTPDLVCELINIGVISYQDEIAILKKELHAELFNDFISCVHFFILNPQCEEAIYKLRNASRNKLQKACNMEKKPTVVDFFCGAGGLSCGFVQAGYKIILANEIQDVCCETYKYNHPELPANKVLEADIKSVVQNIEQYVSNPVDIVVGGPPCQGFSSANQQRIIDDPRNELYKYYLKAVERLCPKIVLMENVKGMLEVANQVVEDYRAIKIRKGGNIYSYDISYRLLNSQNFSVAQSRERLIYIAIRNDVAKAKNITPDSVFKLITNACEGNPTYNLSEALAYIRPLQAPRIKGTTETDDELTGMKIGLNEYSSSGNSYLKLINGGKQDAFVFNHKARYCSDTNYEIFRRLNQGDDATDPKIADIMPYAHRNHCFKDKYYRLIANRPCRTITAHLKMDCLSHIHPTQTRSITPREAARIQSFPDDYLFLGAYLKTYMQIGNAVPVLMAKSIASILKEFI